MNINAITNKTIIRVLSITLAFFIGLWLVVQLQRELFWLLTAFFLAVSLNPAVTWFQKWLPKHNRPTSIGAVFVALTLVVSGISYMLIPPLIDESQNLIQTAPQSIENLRDSDNTVAKLVDRYELVDRIKEEQERIFAQISRVTGSFVGIAQGLFSNIIAFVVVLTLTFFMLIEGPTWISRMLDHQSKEHQVQYRELLDRLYAATRSYTIGNLLRSLIITIATLIPLVILGIPYALPLSIFMGVLNLIPLIGATIGAVIVVIVCLFVSVPVAIFMAVYFIIYQQLENNVIQPYIFGKTLELSGLTVLVSALVGAKLAGLLGAFVAIPAAAAIRILITHHAKYSRHKPKL